MKRLIKSSTIQANRLDELLDILDDSFSVTGSENINAADDEGKKNIRLTSIPGVTRDKENDFRDDGTYFQMYLYKNVVPISYARYQSDVYITVAFHHLDNMSYEEYKDFPSYRSGADKYNGVPANQFNAADFQSILEEAYNDIQNFASNVSDADEGELEGKIAIINEASQAYKQKVEDFLSQRTNQILELSDYQFKQLKNYVKSAGTRTADYIRDASQSSKRDFLRKDVKDLTSQISSEWNFKYIEEMFQER